MYKASRYNWTEYFGSTAMIYNSLIGQVVRLDYAEDLRDVLCSQTLIAELTEERVKKLYDYGYIVDTEIDESVLGKMCFYNQIFSPELSLVLLPTEQCNFRCRYCYESFSRGKMSEECQNAVIKYVKKNISQHNALNVSWFGGEPMLAMDVIENLSCSFIKVCHDMNRQYSGEITTNGYLLTSPNMDVLRKCRINSIQVTLDGPQEIHDNGRVLIDGSGTFEVILQNLRNIRDNYKSASFKIDIRVNVTVQLLPKLSRFIEFLYSEFADDPRFSFYFRPVGDWGGERVKKITNSMVGSLDSFYDILTETKRTLNTDSYIQLLNSPLCSAALKNHYIIGADASVYKCTMLFDNPQNKIGQLDSTGVIQFDIDKYAKWVIRDFENPNCKSCFYAPKCSGGICPAIGIAISGDFCGYEKKSIRHVLKLIYRDSLSTNSRSKILII